MSAVLKSLSSVARRLASVNQQGYLRAQAPNMCVFDHKDVIRAASGLGKDGSWKTLSNGIPTVIEVRQALQKGPCLFVASNICKTGSKYTGHHAVALIAMKDDDKVLIVDRDDTTPGEQYFYTTSLRDFLASARLPLKLVQSIDEADHLEQVDPVLQQVEESSSWCSIM